MSGGVIVWVFVSCLSTWAASYCDAQEVPSFEVCQQAATTARVAPDSGRAVYCRPKSDKDREGAFFSKTPSAQ